mmetsp:Transcript_2279/g.4928  ORF Transcript_2279/g.4928 Transcript_2279/m.4928 type:complete len:138 (-) Transcript_2279:9-422(-)
MAHVKLMFLAGLLALILVVLWSSVGGGSYETERVPAPPRHPVEPERNGNEPLGREDDLRPSGSRTRIKPVLQASPIMAPTLSPIQAVIPSDVDSSQSTGPIPNNATSSRDDFSKDFRFCRLTELVPTDPAKAALPVH